MKRLTEKARIYNADTLEYIGDYEPESVGIIGRNELVLDFRTYWPTWVFLVGFLVALCICTFHQDKQLEQVKAERDTYKEIFEDVSQYHTVELLAGTYATSRKPIPSDKDTIYKFVVQSGAWYPEVVMAQLIVESGSGTSNVYRNSNNLFGMKKIGTKGRPTLQIPGSDYSGYGMYLNWQHSVLDRVLWERWFFRNSGKPATMEEYLRKIDGVYAEDPEYIKKVVKIASEWANKTDSLVVDPMDTLKHPF